jgi:hypothetical protein
MHGGAMHGSDLHGGERKRRIAEQGLILKVLVGSGVHGGSPSRQQHPRPAPIHPEGRGAEEETVAWARELAGALELLLERSPLPDRPDTAGANAWLVDLYQTRWSAPRPG